MTREDVLRLLMMAETPHTTVGIDALMHELNVRLDTLEPDSHGETQVRKRIDDASRRTHAHHPTGGHTMTNLAAWLDEHRVLYRWGRFRCAVLRQHTVACRGRRDHHPRPGYTEWRGLRRNIHRP